ncbi:MAG: nicotinate (nicotinamide) nucleotide adenylyltransferase [Treponema sp.]|nr:nicotinate (nicotinamide) nucleotide adenylyltransferase [Candidatus Treponema equi]
MKIAVLGGSFNPVHIGHLALADQVCTSLGYDKVLFVPAAAAPHKTMACQISAETRAHMVGLAIEDDPRFALELCEIERGGTSYTWDTICHLEEKYKDSLEGKIGLIIGRDQFATFHLWRNAKELSEKCTLILGERPIQNEDKDFTNKATGSYGEYSGSDLEKFNIADEVLFKDAVFLDNEPLAVSSTGIRSRAAGGKAFRYLVPAKVFKYIIDGNIYGKH